MAAISQMCHQYADSYC